MMKLSFQTEGVYIKALERFRNDLDQKESAIQKDLNEHEVKIEDFKQYQQQILVKKKMV